MRNNQYKVTNNRNFRLLDPRFNNNLENRAPFILIRNSCDLLATATSRTREQILFLDSSNDSSHLATRCTCIHWQIPHSFDLRSSFLSRRLAKVIFREFTEVYTCYKITIPPDTTMITPVRCSRSSGRLFWIVSHRETVKNPPRTRRRSNVHAFYDSPNAKRDGTRGSLSWNERVNVTSRNNLGLERVNAKSGVQIVRRAKQRQPPSRYHAISMQNPSSLG